MTRNKITIVAGKVQDLGDLASFEELARRYDISVCLTAADSVLRHSQSALKINVFKEIIDMPGYMRGLEDILLKSDLVITLGTSQLSSFQVSRFCAKMKKPFIAVSFQTKPFLYADFPNVRAMQADVMAHAAAFVVTSTEGHQALALEGVIDDKIHMAALSYRSDRFRLDATLREKFRRYINVKPDEFLAMVRCDEQFSRHVSHAIKAFRIADLSQYDRRKNMKLLFVGSPQTTFDTQKYLAYDLGVGSQVMFLQQDVSGFAADLFNGIDCFVTFKNDAADQEHFPRWWLEAVACGAYPLLSERFDIKSLFDGNLWTFHDESEQSIFGAWRDLMQGSSAERRVEISRAVQSRYDSQTAANQWTRIIDMVLVQSESLARREVTIGESVSTRVLRAIGRGDVKAAQEIIDQARFNQDIVHERAEDLWLRGEVALAGGDYDAATHFLTQSVQLNDKNTAAFLSLGKIAFCGHSHEEALKFYKRALAKDSTNLEAMLGLGGVYRRLRMSEEAIYWYSRSIGLEKSNRRAVFGLTQSCLEYENPSVAVAYLEKALETVGESETALTMALGKLYLQLGDVDKGKALVERAMQDQTKNDRPA